MKIKYVKIKNINSLRGEHLIDFSKPPLSDAGLFAITGPTGSGKSTILDAICLALFNRIPRLGTISKNSISDSGSILTRHEKEAVAEVGYVCSKGEFISRWSIAVNRNQNLNDYDMQLEDVLNEQLIDLKKSEVPAQNEAHIGLNFDQFVKSMMLAQGEFAKFLKSNADERNHILERITDSAVYRQLGILAFERNKQFGNELEQLKKQKQLKEAEIQPDEALKQLESELVDLDKKWENGQKEVNQITQQLSNFERIAQLENEIEKLNRQLEGEEKKLQSFKVQHAEQMKKHQVLMPHEKALAEYRQMLRDNEQLENRVENLKKEQQAFLEQKSIQQNNIQEFVQKADLSEKDITSAMQAVNSRYNELAQKRSTIGERYYNFKKQAEGLSTGLSLDFKKPEESQSLIASQLKEMKAQQSTLTEKLGNDFDEDRLDAIRESQIAKERMTEYQEVIKKLSAEFQKQEEHEKKLQEQTKQVEQELPLNEKALKQAQKEVELLQKELQLEQQKASLEDLRGQLEDGKPCPLCGSEHHPYAAHLPQKASELDMRINAAKDVLQQQESTFQKLKEQQLLQSSELNNLRNQLDRIGTDLKQAEEQQILAEQKVHELYRNNSPKELAVLFQEGKKLLSLNLSLQQVESLSGIWDELIEIVNEGAQIRQQMDALYTGSNFSDDYDRLNREWNHVTTQLMSNKKALDESEKELEKLHDQVESQSSQLMSALKPLGYSSIQSASDDLMASAEYSRLQEQQSAISQAISSIKSGLGSYQSQRDDYKKKISGLDMEVLQQKEEEIKSELKHLQKNRDEHKAVLNIQHRLKQELEAINEQIASCGKSARKWQLLKEMIGDSEGKKFSDFAQRINLKQLIIASNQRLKDLNPRYLLNAPDDKKSDLFVYDMDMGELPRSVNTLSGGETFLISLALALGLADMASQKVDIKSLFIDEGFGTLDPDALESTLAMLEKLQMDSGKTIGIISHVDALKERIRAQIKLEKTGQGYSRLEIVG